MAVSWKAAAMAAAVVCMMLASSAMVLQVPPDPSQPRVDARGAAADAGERTVDYAWYDFFGVPCGEWWTYRYPLYGTDLPVTDSFPYIYWHLHNSTHTEIFSSARLNITGRDMPEINMEERPLFLPFLSGEDGPRGGNVAIDWYMQYMTLDEMYPYPTYPDGWLVSLNGTVRLDRTAAMAVLNLTSDDFDDIEPWWDAHEAEVENAYIDWLMWEGNERLDIYPMYEYPLTPLVFRLEASSHDSEIVLEYDIWSWGMEAMMTRWLHDAFMPTEWWFEDFTMHAEIGPDSADIDIDTAVTHAVQAWESKEGGAPCWVWQGMLQDSVPSTIVHPYSAFDMYSDKLYLCQAPGSPWYDYMVSYARVPGCHNLSEGESLSFEWPAEEILFVEHAGPYETTNVTGKAVVEYSEPMATDMEGGIDCVPAERTLTFEGPIDFWTWSRDQAEHAYLSDEWDRLGLLPWGMPLVELSPWPEDTPPVAHIEAMLSAEATSASMYFLDASGSGDSEDDPSDLEFRWDLDGDGTMDTDWSGEPQAEVDFGGAGTFTVSVSVKDTDNMTGLATAEVTVPEVDPPVTQASIGGVPGENGWFVSAVTVGLTVQDDSGVAATEYRLDGLGWEPYSAEFYVSSEGNHTLEFYSVDAESNYEEAREMAFKVDFTAPTASFVSYFPEYGSPPVTVDWSSSDATSGVAYSVLTLDGGAPMEMGSASSHTFEGLEEGNHTLVLTVFDHAGNNASDTYTFSVEGGIISDPQLPLGLLIAAVVVVAAVAGVLLLARRKPPT